MPINRNTLLRYKTIDRMLRRGRRVTLDELIDACNDALYEVNGYGEVSRRTIQHDIQEIAPNAKLYLFDLVGYGQSPISMERDDVFCIAGWSDKVFDILTALERGNSAIDEIRRIIV